MTHLCQGWLTEARGGAAACPGMSHARAAPPALPPGGCVLGSGRRRAAGGPASRGSAEPGRSSRRGAPPPAGAPAHTPTSATTVCQRGGYHGNSCPQGRPYQRGAGEVVHVQSVHFLFQVQTVAVHAPANQEGASAEGAGLLPLSRGVCVHLQWMSVWIRWVYPCAAARWSSVIPRWRDE